MGQLPLHRQSGRATIFRVLVVCEAGVFLFAAALHTGAFTEPQLIPAMIVEGLCGIGFAFCAYVVLTRKTWARTATIVVHVLALVGVLLGVSALIASPGLRTPMNVVLHSVMLVLIVTGLSLLAIPNTRKAFESTHAS
jgi:hypothetical protein